MSLEVCTYGNPILRKKAVKVTQFDTELRELAKRMLEAMHAECGIGLAAEQVGRTERMFVIDIPPENDLGSDGQRENPATEMPLVFINPCITGHSDAIRIKPEGCLSFPGIFADVKRWYEVDAEYASLEGSLHPIHAKGLLARVIQHELDHLNGVLLVDRMSAAKKATLAGKLKRLTKRTRQVL